MALVFVSIQPACGFPCGSGGKDSACNAGDLGSIPGLGRSPGERKGYPLRYSGLENSMDCIVHGVTKSWTQLSNFHLNTLMFGFNDNTTEAHYSEHFLYFSELKSVYI